MSVVLFYIKIFWITYFAEWKVIDMNGNLKKMLSYYKPYIKMFWADMFFAALSAAVALTIPLVVRYVTSSLIYQEKSTIIRQVTYIGLFLAILLIIY